MVYLTVILLEILMEIVLGALMVSKLVQLRDGKRDISMVEMWDSWREIL